MNAIRVIHPRWEDGVLVFDDPAVGLHREPFVAGADEVLGLLSGGAEEFTVLFSDAEFPGSQATFTRLREEHGGWWYEFGDMEGWLCPALFKYFDEAPDQIHIQIKEKK